MTNISTATRAELRNTLRAMRAENVDASTQLDLIHSDIIGMDPATFEHNGGNTDPDQAVTIRIGRMMIRCLAKNAARTAAKLRSACRTPSTRQHAGPRIFPKFDPGMSTAQYINKYNAFNREGAGGGATLPYNLAHHLKPCALYEGGSLDFEAIEEPIDAPESTTPPEMAEIMLGSTAQAARQVSELIASASAAAAIEQAATGQASSTSTAEAEEHTSAHTADTAELATVDAEADTEATSAAHQDTTRAEATNAQQPAPTPQSTSASSRRQHVEGKSGNWRASMFKDDHGRPSFEFEGPGGSVEVWTFETGRERMAALQAMAREADRQAEAEDNENDLDDTENTHANHAATLKTAGNTHTAQSGIQATAPACAEDVHSTPGAYPGTQPAAEQEQHQQNPAVPSHSDKVPQDLGARSEAAEFERATPQPFDVAALMAGGMTADDFVGLGIVYSGDRANLSGTGAITAIEPGPMRGWKITVTLEDGRQLPCDPYSFDDHPGSRCKTNFKRHGAPYLAQLAAARLLATSNRKAAEQAAADAAARQRRELPAQWPQLKAYTPAGKLQGCTLAAANIRILLKERFPGVKFSVKCDRFSMGNAINISWTDGPALDAVEDVAGMFKVGHFNGMDDSYEYSRSAFKDVFGDAKYIHCTRDISISFLAAAIAEQFPDAANRPSVEDYRQGKGAFCPYTHEYNSRRIRERLNTMTPPTKQ